MSLWVRTLFWGWLGTCGTAWAHTYLVVSCHVQSWLGGLCQVSILSHVSSSSRLPGHTVMFSRWQKEEYQQKCSSAFSRFFLDHPLAKASHMAKALSQKKIQQLHQQWGVAPKRCDRFGHKCKCNQFPTMYKTFVSFSIFGVVFQYIWECSKPGKEGTFDPSS